MHKPRFELDKILSNDRYVWARLKPALEYKDNDTSDITNYMRGLLDNSVWQIQPVAYYDEHESDPNLFYVVLCFEYWGKGNNENIEEPFDELSALMPTLAFLEKYNASVGD